MDEIDKAIAALTPAQERFMRTGEEGIFADRRVTRALSCKGLMGLAGYVLGYDLHAFTAFGEQVRARLNLTERQDGTS